MSERDDRERRPRVRVGVLLVRDGQVLLVQHRRGDDEYWLLPGGGLDWGESIAQCGVRECKEELGLDVEVDDIVAVAESLPPHARRHILHIALRGRIVGGNEQLGIEPRLVGMRWHSLETWPDLIFFPPVVEELLAVVRGTGPTLPNLGPRWRELS